MGELLVVMVAMNMNIDVLKSWYISAFYGPDHNLDIWLWLTMHITITMVYKATLNLNPKPNFLFLILPLSKLLMNFL